MKNDHIPDVKKMVGLLRTYNEWRRGETDSSMDELGLNPTDVGNAIDAVLDDYATLQAERDALQQQVKALQSAENSYQSGFDAGRDSSAKFADDWRKECERVRRKFDAVLLQAQCWAMEAKTQQSITREVGEILGGIPDWGPISETLQGKLERLEKAESELAARPTAEAYDAACKALWKHRDELAALKEQKGWKPVPTVPTIEMLAALGFGGDVDMTIGHASICEELSEVYAKVLAAAPAVNPQPE